MWAVSSKMPYSKWSSGSTGLNLWKSSNWIRRFLKKLITSYCSLYKIYKNYYKMIRNKNIKSLRKRAQLSQLNQKCKYLNQWCLLIWKQNMRGSMLQETFNIHLLILWVMSPIPIKCHIPNTIICPLIPLILLDVLTQLPPTGNHHLCLNNDINNLFLYEFLIGKMKV